jgi:hypothetical protein
MYHLELTPQSYELISKEVYTLKNIYSKKLHTEEGKRGMNESEWYLKSYGHLPIRINNGKAFIRFLLGVKEYL